MQTTLTKQKVLHISNKKLQFSLLINLLIFIMTNAHYNFPDSVLFCESDGSKLQRYSVHNDVKREE